MKYKEWQKLPPSIAARVVAKNLGLDRKHEEKFRLIIEWERKQRKESDDNSVPAQGRHNEVLEDARPESGNGDPRRVGVVLRVPVPPRSEEGL